METRKVRISVYSQGTQPDRNHKVDIFVVFRVGTTSITIGCHTS